MADRSDARADLWGRRVPRVLAGLGWACYGAVAVLLVPWFSRRGDPGLPSGALSFLLLLFVLLANALLWGALTLRAVHAPESVPNLEHAPWTRPGFAGSVAGVGLLLAAAVLYVGALVPGGLPPFARASQVLVVASAVGGAIAAPRMHRTWRDAARRFRETPGRDPTAGGRPRW